MSVRGKKYIAVSSYPRGPEVLSECLQSHQDIYNLKEVPLCRVQLVSLMMRG